ncbi:hypothetical protein [Xylanimonas protaetiae]|uniref:Uncharacterized protein n=1 Tax=Xylanimonas protaetiae TaxID=2509457 RepID=A0A4P6F8F0_9MICO|nr:hypothetical protein [Xylanimonas protaetiae]QAY69557.1 hypothetical protein ET471_05455 [Xylanimonas protaetiae]
MATLDTHDPKQVFSAQVLDVDLGVGGRRLIVASGIACPEWKIDTDEVAHGADTILLHIPADRVEQVSVHVGLASITNDDSSYTFAVDEARVAVDEATGELVLSVKSALMGEWSSLSRYSYQVVAAISRDTPEVAGTIHWPKALFAPEPLPSVVSGHLAIMLNERTTSPAGGPFGGVIEHLSPIGAGEVVAVSASDTDVSVRYRIVAPPKGAELRVTVKPVGFPGPGTVSAGPDRPGADIFTLDLSHASRTGVDFFVSADEVIR